MRGGTRVRHIRPCRPRGLSPRARGNPCWQEPGAARPRSIPACAGEPSTVPTGAAQTPVYPRVRGGTVQKEGGKAGSPGLSPRARGNRTRTMSTVVSLRSIPACAGEPPSRCTSSSASRVYPRVRGGTGFGIGQRERRPGLSPRARGNRIMLLTPLAASGSIPACAGEPLKPLATLLPDEVYPRVRGGTVAWSALGWRAGGLSPRARGNLSTVCDAIDYSRSIPACAGEPISSSS